MNNEILAIIQARSSSRRLPGKVFLDLAGRTVLERVIERVGQAKKISKVIVATSDKQADDRLAELCKQAGADCFRGSEDDVLDRYYRAARHFGFSNIVRITGDCPVIDPEVIDQVVALYQSENLDYASNVIPPTWPDGLDTEIFSLNALEKAWREARINSAREHVTVYMWQNPALFKQKHLLNPINLSNRRWVLDNPEDYELIKEIYGQLYPSQPNFRLKDLLEFFSAHPELEKVNQNIKRNEGLAKSLQEDVLKN